jgi:hypothetical protein
VLHWLTYTAGDRPVGVVITDAPDLLQARFRAAVHGFDEGKTFGEGHELGPEHDDLVPERMRDRMLSLADASRLIRRLPHATPKRPPAPSVRPSTRRAPRRSAR